MPRKFLSFRDEEMGLETKNLFASHDLELENFPLYEIEALPVNLPDLSIYKRAILTSKNALKFKEISFWQELSENLEFLVIGKSFAEFLEKNKITNYRKFDDSEGLASFVAKEQGENIYFRGEVVSFDFKQIDKGLSEVVCYKVNYLNISKEKLVGFIKEKQVTDLIFLSKENASFFSSVIEKGDIEALNICCLSSRIAEVLVKYDNEILVPKTPNLDSVISLVV